MGRAIEEIALERKHEIVLKISQKNLEDFNPANLKKADVAIEFTNPESAAENVKQCFNSGVPVVCGSTGWLEKWEEVKNECLLKKGSLIYASNFSIGVNIFFELNKYLSKVMDAYDEYDVKMQEIHHTQKKDSPSGTAITLAKQIMENIKRKKTWVNHLKENEDELEIASERMDQVPGTHKILYTSAVDDIEIIHTAHSRIGFASGAVKAAEFLQDKKGIFTMKDVLGL